MTPLGGLPPEASAASGGGWGFGGDCLLVEVLYGWAQVGAVGDRGRVTALLVTADHADDRAGPRRPVELRDPGAAAGASGKPVALEPQLRDVQLGGPVPACDRGVAAGGIAGDAHQVAVSGVERQPVGAEYVLDVLSVVRFEHHEPDVEAGIGVADPLRRDQQVPR